jgi:spermidine/putrescine ABC transporter ATP-binding subunit
VQGRADNGARSGPDPTERAEPRSGSPAVSIRDVRRRFGDVTALDGVSLDVQQGEFMSILGPSGCGKTTLLRIIGGFETPDEGAVSVGGVDMARVPPHRRPANTVFQRYALFPHMSVGENVAFGLALKRRPKAEVRQKVDSLLRLVHLDGFGDRMPTQLSGGQAQRVALARALANDPVVLLLDEPLAALDLKLRQAMHVELRQIQRTVGSTFLYVTHDQEEALSMSDRITLMNAGRIEQIGPPIDVYRNPRSRFVSSFIGEANIFEGRVVSPGQPDAGDANPAQVDCGNMHIRVRPSASAGLGDAVSVCIRPESMMLRSPDSAQSSEGGNVLSGVVASTVFLGPAVRYFVDIGDRRQVTVHADAGQGDPLFSPGDRVLVVWSSTMGTLISDVPR